MNGPDSAVEERWTAAGGFALFCRVSAVEPERAEPVVLVHGFAVSARTALPTLRALATTFRTYAPDLPGFGRSQRPDHALSIAELAGVLAAWLDAEGIERPVLVGHSLGCQIVAELAHRYPGRMALAVLVAPAGDQRGRNPAIQLARLARDAFHEPPRLAFIVVRDYLRFGVRRGLALLRSMSAHPMSARLAGLQIPTLLVVGEHDPIVPPAWRAEVLARLPNGRSVIIPGGAHGIPFTHPEALAAAIRAFVDAAASGDAGRTSRSGDGPSDAGR